MASGILGRLGNVGQVLLEQRLKDEEADKNRDALYAQQASLSRQGLFNNLAEKLSTKVLAGETDVSKLSPQMQALLADAGAAAPTDQMKTGALIGEWGKAPSPDKLPSREEQIAAMQAKGMNVATSGMEFDPLKRTQFSDENGTIGGSEEGLLPAYTRGAEQENPLLTQSSTAVGAAKGRLQQGIEDATARHTAEQQSDFNINNPAKPLIYLQKDSMGKATMSVADPTAPGGFRPPTPEDLNGPYEIREGAPQQQVVMAQMGELPAGAMDIAADRYLFVDGTPPPYLRNPVQMKEFQEAVDRRAKWARSLGVNVSPGAAAANMAALKAGNTALTKQAQLTGVAAKTAIDNLDLVAKASPQVTRTDSAWINQHVLEYIKGITPAEALSDFEVKAYTAAREYAKVVTGSTGSVAELSAAASAQATALLGAAKSPRALTATIAAMKADMANVTNRQMQGATDASNVIRNLVPTDPGQTPTTPTAPRTLTPEERRQKYGY